MSMIRTPHPVRLIAGTTSVGPRDTLVTVLQRFGQPPSAYVELAGANLAGPFEETATPRGVVAVPRLRAGQRVNVPASWVKAQGREAALRKNGHLSGPGGFLADATEDTIKAIVGPASGLGISQASYNDLMAVLAGFWRRDKGTALPVNRQEIAPYETVAESFRKNVLPSLPSGVAARIPFSTIPLSTLMKWWMAKFPLTLVNWAALNKYLVSRVAPGQFPDTGAAASWTELNLTASAMAQAGITPAWWVMLTEPRWDLLPLSQIDPKSYTGGDPTTWLARQVRNLTTDPNSSSQQDAFPAFPQIPGIDFATCGLGQVKVGDKCLGAGAPNLDGTCPQGTISYKGLCLVSPCAIGETPNVTQTGITCTPGGGGLPGGLPTLPGTLPGAPNGSIASGLPGGCPPGATATNGSCDCSPLGPRYVLDPSFENGVPACVDCGLNAYYNANTKQCSCQPGFVAPTEGDLGRGCVPANSPTTVPPVPGKETTTVIVNKDEPSTFARVATVTGLALGAATIYLGWKNINKNSRRA